MFSRNTVFLVALLVFSFSLSSAQSVWSPELQVKTRALRTPRISLDQDLMTGVDKVIEMGVADPNRVGVMGWSYGGYMTSTIITKTNASKQRQTVHR